LSVRSLLNSLFHISYESEIKTRLNMNRINIIFYNTSKMVTFYNVSMKWALGLYGFFWKRYRLMEHETAQFLITMSFGCFWIFRNNSTVQKYENLPRWYENRIYRTYFTLQNLREKLMVAMITMLFCRAWKTASTRAISFHIVCTIKKITGTIVITPDVQKW
jgi:hypothetical protein